MKHEIIMPDAVLKRYIRHFWILKFDANPGEEKAFKMFARKYPRMILQHAHGKSAITSGSESLPMCYLGGLNSMPYDCRISLDATSIVGVSFYPDALNVLFDMDASEIVNQTPELVNFLPPSFIERVMEAPEEYRKIKLLENYFVAKLLAATDRNPFLNVAWHIINTRPAEIQLRGLHRMFPYSERHFRSRFQERTGYSPKQFLRIARFERALSLLQTDFRNSLTYVAYECNYTDQSHFIREFREFAGVTPTSYLKTTKIYHENAAFIPK